MQVGQFLQEWLRLGRGGKDASDCCERKGAEADGAFQGFEHIVASIVGDEGQQLLGLPFALDLSGEQTVEESQTMGPSSLNRCRKSSPRWSGSLIARKLIGEMIRNWTEKHSKQLAFPPDLVERIGDEAHRINEQSNGKEGGRIV